MYPIFIKFHEKGEDGVGFQSKTFHTSSWLQTAGLNLLLPITISLPKRVGSRIYLRRKLLTNKSLEGMTCDSLLAIVLASTSEHL